MSAKKIDYLGFLWWENGDTHPEHTEYRMKVYLFGALSSPGCSNYGMKHLASQNEEDSSSAASFIRKHFYVDDGLLSVKSVGEAIELVKEAQAVCTKGNLHLQKFLIAQHQDKIQHQGRGQTLFELRANGYWIVGEVKP